MICNKIKGEKSEVGKIYYESTLETQFCIRYLSVKYANTRSENWGLYSKHSDIHNSNGQKSKQNKVVLDLLFSLVHLKGNVLRWSPV